MCCSVLQCVLPCVAVRCSVLQRVAACCSVLQCLTRSVNFLHSLSSLYAPLHSASTLCSTTFSTLTLCSSAFTVYSLYDPLHSASLSALLHPLDSSARNDVAFPPMRQDGTVTVAIHLAEQSLSPHLLTLHKDCSAKWIAAVTKIVPHVPSSSLLHVNRVPQ